jgi:hypothetical protein
MPLIIAITETWLDSGFPSHLLNHNDMYLIFRHDRNFGKGGGVLLMVHKSLNPIISPSLDHPDIEGIWCDLHLYNTLIRIGVVYRPPRFDPIYLQTLINVTNLAISVPHPTLIIGDFNFPHIDWVNNVTTCSLENTFLHFCTANALTQCVESPTRNKHILDLILTNDPTLICGVDTTLNPVSSDHLAVSFHLCFPLPNKSTPHTFPNYNKITLLDHTNITNFLLQINWTALFRNSSIDLCWSHFKHALNTAVAAYVPHRTMKLNTRTPWMNSWIKKLQNHRLHCFRNWKRTRNDSNLLKLQQSNHLFSKEIKLHKHRYELRLSKLTNRKEFFRYCNHKLHTNPGIPALLSPSSNTLLLEDYEKATLMNNTFLENFTKDDGTLPAITTPRDLPELSNITISNDLVLTALNSLRPNSSPGPDNIHPSFLKRFADCLCTPLCLLFNLSLKQHLLPLDWKTAIILPTYKGKGSRNSPKNYRPISLTSVVCKVLERIIKTQLTYFLTQSHQLCPHQFGFLKNSSTTDQLLHSTEKWTRILDDNFSLDIIYLDFSKAFDSVPHSKLFHKLSHIGVSDNILKWIKSYLSSRLQCVRINKAISPWLPVTSGVPQGSVLGPLLFIIYVNDLPDHIKFSEIVLYADDCKLHKRLTSPTDCLLLQSDLTAVENWSQTWQLPLNPSKCNVLHMGKKDFRGTYRLQDQTLPVCTDQSDLGVHVSQNLKYSKHCAQIASKSFFLIRAILKGFSVRDPKILTSLFVIYVRPALEYASTVWNPQLQKDIQTLEKVQRYFTSKLPGLTNLPYPTRLSVCKIPSLQTRRTFLDLVQTYKIIHNLSRLPSDDFFKIASATTTRGHPLRLLLPHTRTNTRMFTFSIRVIPLWNALPHNIVTAPTLANYKSLLRAHLSIT